MGAGGTFVSGAVEIERDEKGWPEAWWRLAGSAPEFDVGDRATPPGDHDVIGGDSD